MTSETSIASDIEHSPMDSLELIDVMSGVDSDLEEADDAQPGRTENGRSFIGCGDNEISASPETSRLSTEMTVINSPASASHSSRTKRQDAGSKSARRLSSHRRGQHNNAPHKNLDLAGVGSKRQRDDDDDYDDDEAAASSAKLVSVVTRVAPSIVVRRDDRQRGRTRGPLGTNRFRQARYSNNGSPKRSPPRDIRHDRHSSRFVSDPRHIRHVGGGGGGMPQARRIIRRRCKRGRSDTANRVHAFEPKWRSRWAAATAAAAAVIGDDNPRRTKEDSEASDAWVRVVSMRDRRRDGAVKHLFKDSKLARQFEKALSAFGGTQKVFTDEMERSNRRFLRHLATHMSHDDCDETHDAGRNLTFPALDENAVSDLHAGISWQRLCDLAPKLKSRWSINPALARLACTVRAVTINNARAHELLELCDETLTWMLWHERAGESVYPHDPIFSNMYVLCVALHNRLGPAMTCYLHSVGSTLTNQTRFAELPMESAKCPLTFLFTFIDRFMRRIHKNPGVTIMGVAGVDPTHALVDRYAPGMCVHKIPLALAKHSSVCKNDDCRVVCAQLVGKQYAMGKFFRVDMFA